jgi:hypothetical protein
MARSPGDRLSTITIKKKVVHTINDCQIFKISQNVLTHMSLLILSTSLNIKRKKKTNLTKGLGDFQEVLSFQEGSEGVC